jgi:hypothetical protein
MTTKEDQDNIGLPVEWMCIRTGKAYTLLGLSNLTHGDRYGWPVIATYTDADGRMESRTLAWFLGAMRAVTGRRMGTESVPVEPEEAPAVPEPDVAEATEGLPEGWREVVPGRVWARGARVTVRDSMDGSDIPFHVHVDGCRFLSVESMDLAIHYADEWYPATNYP